MASLNCELRVNFRPQCEKSREVLKLVGQANYDMMQIVFDKATDIRLDLTLEQLASAVEKCQINDHPIDGDIIAAACEFMDLDWNNIKNAGSLDLTREIRSALFEVATQMYVELHCVSAVSFYDHDAKANNA